MFFTTHVKENNIDIGKIREQLIQTIDKSWELFDSQSKKKLKQIKEILKKSERNNFASRYGLKNVNFADSELISAAERNEDAVKYLIYRYDFKKNTMEHIKTEFPMVLAIEATSNCNLKCKMCFQTSKQFKEMNKSNSVMSMEIYKKILCELKENTLYSMVFASRGEPLLNPNIGKMIRLAKQEGVLDIKLNTNATLLTEDKSRELLFSGLDMIVFSIDSIIPSHYTNIRGYDLQKVLKNVDKFLEIKKKEFPCSKIKTRVSMVITKDYIDKINEEVEEAKKYWLEKVDELAIKSENDFIHVYNKDNSLNELNICNLLWERLYIWYDGKVNPCDIDYLSYLEMGNIKENTIKEIWNSKEMNMLRKEHLKNRNNTKYICKNCEGF